MLVGFSSYHYALFFGFCKMPVFRMIFRKGYHEKCSYQYFIKHVKTFNLTNSVVFLHFEFVNA